MKVPARDQLLDIQWITRTHASEGFRALVEYLRRGAETYGGPVTAVAEALAARHRVPIPVGVQDFVDLRHGLAHRILSGSWTPLDPDARAAHRDCLLWILNALWTRFPERRPEHLESWQTDCAPRLPNLDRLSLVPPLDRAWLAHSDGIWACDVSRDGRCVVSASRDGDLVVWDMDADTMLARVSTGELELRDCEISPDGSRLVSLHATGRVSIWGFPSLALLTTFEAPARPRMEHHPRIPPNAWASPRRVKRFAWSADGSRLAVAGWDAVDLWDLRRLELEREFAVPVESSLPPGILAVCFDSDTTLRIVARNDVADVLTWDVVAQKEVGRSTLAVPNAKKVQRAMVSPDSQYLVCSGVDTTVTGIGGSVTTLPYGSFGQAIAVSRDAPLIATCGFTREPVREDRDAEPVLRVSSLPDLRELWRCNLKELGCRDIACALAFAPDRRHLVVAGWEGVLRRIVLPDLPNRERSG